MDAFTNDQVQLRPFRQDDAEALAAYLNHPDLIGRRQLLHGFEDAAPFSEAQISKLIEHCQTLEEGLAFAITAASQDQAIGHIHLEWSWDPHCPGASLAIAPDQQRQGYGRAALTLGLDYLFANTLAHNVDGRIASWNQAGLDFAAAMGFQRCGAVRRAGIRAGRYYDLVAVDLLRPEWEARHVA